MRVILASGSPRRRELLRQVFDEFEIITADADETLPSGVALCDAVRILARRKGEGVARANPDALVISADTLVDLDGCALGKPTDREDAARMLALLSGRTHSVHTGISVRRGDRIVSESDTTRVRFRELSEAEIADYVATGEPLDKAGAYGIQGLGGRLVCGYEGDYGTVVGLSVELTRRLVDRLLEAENEEE